MLILEHGNLCQKRSQVQDEPGQHSNTNTASQTKTELSRWLGRPSAHLESVGPELAYPHHRTQNTHLN